ncbi:helix-turn-helix domain-containing protein [Ornithinibacillus sp. L9]|uniref:Helix-turn-helix domain-containing protein n=1 Tax=Ornithinibacillus caprae TaxID=2678566 RepID=A0A6N8FIQ7_9BACI|nr:helix-turn-helix domain-containing protein [Ornithinibacillus caprae]
MQFGAVLRRMRKGAGLSQEELAEKLHIARSNISKLERDKMKLSAEDLINWCRSTQAQDVLIAFVNGLDPVSIIDGMQMVGTIILGGLL